MASDFNFYGFLRTIEYHQTFFDGVWKLLGFKLLVLLPEFNHIHSVFLARGRFRCMLIFWAKIQVSKVCIFASGIICDFSQKVNMSLLQEFKNNERKVSSLTELHFYSWLWLVPLDWSCHLELQQYYEDMTGLSDLK